MRRSIGWFAENPVAANLLMAFILAAGLASGGLLRQEPFPSIAFDLISISASYPGASPGQVEEAVTIPIEEAIHAVEGIHRVHAHSSEGYSNVLAELRVDADPRRVMEKIQSRVDGLDSLPEDVDPPTVQELFDDSVLLGIAISGHASEKAMRDLGERVRDDVAALPNVARAELAGARTPEIALEVSESVLRRHRLRFDDVARAVRQSSLDQPGGVLKASDGEILLRSQSQARRGADFERLVLRTRPDGTRLLLGDVAEVRDGFEPSDKKIRFDGKPAIMVTLLSSENRDTIEASRAVHSYLDALRPTLPDGLEAAIWWDMSRQLKARRDLLVRNGAQGLLLIGIVLACFLRLHVALWVCAGLPVAFFGALIGMYGFDISINMMSLFAFIVALGLVVDDAIVVGEGIGSWKSRESNPIRAAIDGTMEVATPVTVAIATTVLFALPVYGLPTFAGKIAHSLGVVLIACLLFSLVEALWILPAHMARGRVRAHAAAGERSRSPLRWIQPRLDAAVERFIRGRYRRLLSAVLRRPGITASLGVSVLMVSLAVMAGDHVRVVFFPDFEDDLVTAHLVLPEGTAPAEVEAAVRHLEEQAEVLRQQLLEEGRGCRPDCFEHVMVAMGDPPDTHDDMNDGALGPHDVTARIQLVSGERRRVTSLEVEERWRKLVGEIPHAVELRFAGETLAGEPALSLQLSGPDREELRSVSGELKALLRARPGTRDIYDSFSTGKRELQLSIRPEAEAFGLTLAELMRQVRQGFHGQEVQRLQRGRDDVAVVVRYPLDERRSLADLENVWIRTPAGGEVPFATVGRIERGRSYSTIRREDRRNVVEVFADVDVKILTATQLLEDLERHDLPALLSRHPEVRVSLAGMKREEAELLPVLGRRWLLAMLAAYAVMAIPFRSYLQPLLVFAVIPFGFVGAVVGHALIGMDFSAFSLVGLVALTGVVVNDALVLIDAVNRQRAAGLSRIEALHAACARRFRAILLTSLTTAFGLLPLLSERSAQAAWLKPMAVTLAVGVLFATVITLLLLPACYLLLDDLRQRLPSAARERALHQASEATA